MTYIQMQILLFLKEQRLPIKQLRGGIGLLILLRLETLNLINQVRFILMTYFTK